ncbi:MAG: hypothetical protein KIS85_05925 [Anaerolineales bacterium]|nr:hypothetical protein [Anaerolineales bacterium]
MRNLLANLLLLSVLVACAPNAGEIANPETVKETYALDVASDHEGPQLASNAIAPSGAAKAADLPVSSEYPASGSFEDCPVTLPQEAFVPPQPHPPQAPYGMTWYGTEALWTFLTPDGKLYADPLAYKLWWFREGYNGSLEQKPDLAVTARRLDAEMPLVEVGPPATNGYHEDFHWGMLTGLRLPSPGCWEFTGHYRENSLSYVVWVGE